MTLAENIESHSIKQIEELPEKFDINPELVPDVDYENPQNIGQVIKNVLEEAEGIYTYRYNKKFQLHQIQKLGVDKNNSERQNLYVVTFSVRVAEVEHHIQRLIQVDKDESLKDAVHEALYDFWGEDNTVQEEYGKHYHRDWQESIRFKASTQVNQGEYDTLKTYLQQWRTI